MKLRYRYEFEGIDELRRRAGRKSANRLRKRVGNVIEEGVRDMAEDSYQMAPKDTTALAQSILTSVEKEAPLTWYYGSTMPYAQRQEYEHKTKRGYFRRSIAKNQILILSRLNDIVGDNFD